MLVPSSVFASSYRIERHLKSGGMGSVYVATHLGTGRLRALKVMQLGLVDSEVDRARFVQEARIGATIRSAHVVEVLDSGVDETLGLPYIAMELLEGEDLATYVAREGPRPFAEARRIAVELGHALGHAHAVGVVHRDLKPENLFLAVSHAAGGGRVLKVLDFGIAKVLGDVARTTAGIGTPLWASPEQLMRGHVGPWTDVWAVGLVFFWLLTGRSYWKTVDATGSGNVVEVLQEITSPTMVSSEDRAAELGFSLPRALAEWLDRCLARDPRGRFPDGGTALEAFAALPDGLVRVVVSGSGGAGVAAHAATQWQSQSSNGMRTVPLGPAQALPPTAPEAPSRPPVAKIPMMQPWDGVQGQDLAPPVPLQPTEPVRRGASIGWIVGGAVVFVALLLVAAGIGSRYLAQSKSGSTDGSTTAPSSSPIASGPASSSPVQDPSVAPPGPSAHPAVSKPMRSAPSSSPSSTPVGPTLQEISLSATGGLTVAHVRGRFSLPAARACYAQFLAKNPSIRGRVIFTYEVGPDGSVAHSTTGGMGDAESANCVSRVPRGGAFPVVPSKSRLEWILEITGP